MDFLINTNTYKANRVHSLSGYAISNMVCIHNFKMTNAQVLIGYYSHAHSCKFLRFLYK